MKPKLRVLIVEDNADDADLIVRELTRGGYEVVWHRVASRAEMLDALASAEWDVVLADYSLPQFNAREALRLSQAADIDRPFIIVSGSIGEDVAVEAMKAGAHDYLMKDRMARLVPVVQREVREAVVRRDRRAAELALRESEEHYRTLIENAQDITLLVAGNGVIRYVTPSIERILGRKPADLESTSIFDMVHADDRGRLRITFARAEADPGGSFTTEVRARHADGTWRTLEAVGRNMVHMASMRAVIVGLRDITERLRLESQLNQAQKMESIGRLAGGVAHDFNNLLTAVLGFAELAALEVPEDSTAGGYIRSIQGAAIRASSLTQQLLAFARRQAVEVRVVDINALINDLGDLLHRLLGEDIEVVTDLADCLWPVRVDAGQMEQVVLNLAVNARDAMPRGGTLTIATANTALDYEYARLQVGVSAGDYVRISVTDTGTGIADEVRDTLFEPFVTTKEPGKGTGLGLATSYGIVKQAGGHITVDTALGVGTTFQVFLPRSTEGVEVTPDLRGRVKPVGGTETVLLVEDEPLVRDLAQRSLRNSGYQVLVAANGVQALEVARAHEGVIDLLLTDVVMPEMGGRELAQRLMDTRPGLRVLCMSGYTESPAGAPGMIDGSLPVLQKPFTPSGLAARVRAVLDQPAQSLRLVRPAV